MHHKLATYLKHNAIAVVALFVALGGSSYAALTISGSQIRNRSIAAVKLDPKSITASVRAWAIVYAGASTAKAGASSSRVRVHAIGSGEVITWPNTRFGRNCMPSVTAQTTVPAGPYGSVTTQFDAAHGSLTLYGFGPDQLGRPQSAYVMIVCP